MGAQALIDGFEDDEALEGGAHVEAAAGLPGGVAGEDRVHVVEDAPGDHVLLAGGVFHQAPFHQALAVLEVDHLLRRGEDHLQRAVQRLVLHDFDEGQGRGGLEAVAAGVDAPGPRLLRQAVHVRQHRHHRRPPAQGHLKARIADALIGHAPALQPAPDEAAGLELPIAQLRGVEEQSAPVQDGGPVIVDPVENPLLLLVHTHSRPVPAPTSSMCIRLPMATFTARAVQWQG